MLKKLGFVIAVILFGGLMFVGGVLAPDNVRGPVVNAADTLVDKVSVARAGGVARDVKKAAASGKGASAKPMAYSALVIPTPPPPKASYALQVDMVTDQVRADALHKRLASAGYSSRVIDVTGADGGRWYVVAAGPYNTRSAARDARIDLSRDLALTSPLPLVLLPSPKKQGQG